ALAERFVPPFAAAFAPGVPLPRAAWCLAAAAALATIHPLGPRVWGAVFGTLRGKFTPAISEWWPITAYPFQAKWPAYLMMLLVAVMIGVGRRRIALFDAAAVILLGASAFLHVRFVPLFALVGAVVLLRTLPALPKRVSLPRWAHAHAAALAIALAVL